MCARAERVPELRVCKVESCPELFKPARAPSTGSLRTGSGSGYGGGSMGQVAAGCARVRDAGARLVDALGSYVDLHVFANRMFLMYFVSSVSVALFQCVPSFFLSTQALAAVSTIMYILQYFNVYLYSSLHSCTQLSACHFIYYVHNVQYSYFDF